MKNTPKLTNIRVTWCLPTTKGSTTSSLQYLLSKMSDWGNGLRFDILPLNQVFWNDTWHMIPEKLHLQGISSQKTPPPPFYQSVNQESLKISVVTYLFIFLWFYTFWKTIRRYLRNLENSHYPLIIACCHHEVHRWDHFNTCNSRPRVLQTNHQHMIHSICKTHLSNIT